MIDDPNAPAEAGAVAPVTPVTSSPLMEPLPTTAMVPQAPQFDLYSVLVPGHDRSHVDNMSPDLRDGLSRMMAEAPDFVKKGLWIASGARSTERQAQLYAEDLAKNGGKPSGMVARPGHSQHEKGSAADLKYGSPEVQQWVHDNAARYGLDFPLLHSKGSSINEPWHIEAAGARNGSVGVPADLKGFIDDAAGIVGIDPKILYGIGWRESKFKADAVNPITGAAGVFQFTPDTWKAALAKFGPIYGIPADTPISNQKAHALMAAALLKDNNTIIGRAIGRPVTDKEAYIGHLLGAPDAITFFKQLAANPNAPVAGDLPGPAKSNRSIFFEANGQPRSYGQVYGILTGGKTPEITASGAAGAVGRPLSPSDNLPSLPFGSMPKEYVGVLKADEMREQSVGFFNALGIAYGDGFTAKALGTLVEPKYAPDPSYTVDMKRVREAGIPKEYWHNFERVVNAQHFEAVLTDVQDSLKAQKRLTDAGLSGTVANIIASVTDPAALAAGFATGGAGDLIAAAANLGRAGRIAVQAGLGAAGGVGYEMAAERLGGPEGNSMVWAGLLGGAFGALYGGLSKNPYARDTAARMSVAQRELAEMAADGSLGARGDLGAAKNPFMDWVFSPEVFEKVADSQVPKTFMGKLRWSISGQLGSSNNPAARLASFALFEDAAGQRLDGAWVVNGVSADLEKSRLRASYETSMVQVWAPAYQEYMKEMGYGFSQFHFKMEEFASKVTDYIRNTDPNVQFSPSVQKMGREIQRIYADFVELINNPMAREGGVARGLTKAPLVENPHYTPRIYMQWKINEARMHFSDSTPIAWFKGAILKMNPDMEEDLLDRLAEGMWKRMVERANGLDDEFEMFKRSMDPTFMRKFMIEGLGLSDEQAERLVKRWVPTGEAAVDPRLKNRILLDENYVLENAPTKTGGYRNFSLNDITNTDAIAVAHQYINRMSGRIALARARVVDPKTGEVILNGMINDAEVDSFIKGVLKKGIDMGLSKEQLEADEKNLRAGLQMILSKPTEAMAQTGQTTADFLRLMRKYNFSRLMNMAGLPQIGEFAITLNEMGVKAALSQIPSFKRVLDMDGRSIRAMGLLNEIEGFLGAGADNLRGVLFNRSDELGYPESKLGGLMGKAEKGMDVANQVTAQISGFTPVNVWIKAHTALAAAQNFADLAYAYVGTGAVKDVPRKVMQKMMSLGMDEDMLKRVLTQVKNHATVEEGLFTSNKLTKLNLNKWADQEARSAFENAMTRWTRRVIQEGDIGSMARWMSGPLAQMMLQFRNYTFNAWDKQFIHQIGRGSYDAFGTMTYVMYTSMLGALLYVAQEKIKAIGRENADDYLEKRLKVGEIAKGAFQKTSWSSIMPMLVDTAAFASPWGPVFDTRSSGQATDAFFGNPTAGLFNDLAQAVKGVGRSVVEGREMSQQEWRNLLKPGLFQNWAPVQMMFNAAISSAPERTPRPPKE